MNRKRWNGRAHDASAEALFERALLGEDSSSGKKFDPREDRKTLQLCRQVQRALSLALAGECSDDMLRDVYVESVEPMGGASQLLVRIATRAPVLEVLARLNERGPRLRAIVAQSICRKRVPMLSFVAVAEGGAQ